MSDQGLWFKLWCSALDDNQLDNLDIADFGRWAKLGAFVKRHGHDGSLCLRPPAKTLCAMLQVSDFDALLTLFHVLPNVIYEEGKLELSTETTATVTFSNWAKFQGDFSTHRVRKFREMKRSRGEEKRREEKRRDESIGATRTHAPKKTTLSIDNWPPDDVWLKELIQTQTTLPIKPEFLLDYSWWQAVSEIAGGITPQSLAREFARMSAHLQEHPEKKTKLTTAFTARRFVRGWLERSFDNPERSLSNGAKK